MTKKLTNFIVGIAIGFAFGGAVVIGGLPHNQNPVEVRTKYVEIERPHNEDWQECYKKAERAIGNRNETVWNIWYDFHGVEQNKIEAFISYCMDNL